MEPEILTPQDYIQILKRRKWSLLLPFVLVVCAAVAAALLLPPVYKSTATILIEDQEIPRDFVTDSVNSMVEQRLQTIHNRIMSSSRLLDIINRFALYPDMRGRSTTEEIIAEMRNSVKMEPTSLEVMDRRTGRQSMATVSFTLSYEGKDSPQKIQQVTNLLTSLFLEENLKTRTRQTEETAEFLESETTRIGRRLDALDKQITDFKEKHIDELPELAAVNQQSLNNIERSIELLTEQLRSTKEREGYLQTQLVNVSPMLQEQDDKKRLMEVRILLVNLNSRLTDQHPDVRSAQAELAELERMQAETDGKPKQAALPDNPAYINLASQLTSTQTEMRSIQQQIVDLKKKADTYRRRMEATPRVAESYNAMNAERANLQAKYDELMQKTMTARVSQGLEKEQKGERFTLIDPPRYPEKPFKPNRIAIVLIGIVLGLGAGIGFAALREFSDQAPHDVKVLEKATTFPVLASVPMLVTPKQMHRLRIKRTAVALVTILMLIGGVALFHFQVMDLNVFWAKLAGRLGV